MQQVLVVVLTLVSVAYLLSRAWRTFTATKSCSGGCGCVSAPRSPASLIAADDLLALVKKRSEGTAGRTDENAHPGKRGDYSA